MLVIPKQLMVRVLSEGGEFVLGGSSLKRESIGQGIIPDGGRRPQQKVISYYGPSPCLQVPSKEPNKKNGRLRRGITRRGLGRPDLPMVGHGAVANGDAWESSCER